MALSGETPEAPNPQVPVALVALTARGAALAERLRPLLPGAVLHGLGGRVEGADIPFDDRLATLRGLSAEGRAIVAICSSGILVRALGPLLADKRAEPPVIALAEDGSAVVPLLGGHRGANALAERIAAALGVPAAITTAGERRWGLALDAPPPGWRLANPQDHKAFAARLLADEAVGLEGERAAVGRRGRAAHHRDRARPGRRPGAPGLPSRRAGAGRRLRARHRSRGASRPGG